MTHAHAGYLLLENGARFDGEALYGEAHSLGEAVFNTSHTGYQEILSDPSYHRQIMTFTTPHIGNVGINSQDVESEKVQAAGVVVRSLAPRPSNWRSEGSLADWLTAQGRCLLAGADTRAITLHLREHGAQRAGLFPASMGEVEALALVKASRDMNGADLAREVTSDSIWTYDGADLDERWNLPTKIGEGLRIAVVDFGVKKNILRELARRGASVEVLPAMTSADEILKRGCHGVLLSNGPGDPAAVSYGIETTQALLGKTPLFGICLGHQILSLAAGLETFKLRFGHRGANHPVRREEDQTVEITSQNHGFAVSSEVAGAEGRAKASRRDEKGVIASTAKPDEAISQFALGSGDWAITHINLNDRTVEGLAHRELPAFSIQYHPEASPGPHEGWVYFDRFLEMVKHAAS